MTGLLGVFYRRGVASSLTQIGDVRQLDFLRAFDQVIEETARDRAADVLLPKADVVPIRKLVLVRDAFALADPDVSAMLRSRCEALGVSDEITLFDGADYETEGKATGYLGSEGYMASKYGRLAEQASQEGKQNVVASLFLEDDWYSHVPNAGTWTDDQGNRGVFSFEKK